MIVITRRNFSKALLPAVTFTTMGSRCNANEILKRNGAEELTVKLSDNIITFIRIPPGSGIVGSKNSLFLEGGAVPHFRNIEITKEFYISKYLLTESDKIALRDAGVLPPKKPSAETSTIKPPRSAAYFSPSDMAAACSYFSKLLDANVTLPTEAQWEYACRASSEYNFYNGDDEESLKKIAWYKETVKRDFWGKFIDPDVGTLEPNGYGIYDMLGIIYEPCIDNFSFSTSNIDPIGQRSDIKYYPMTVRGGHLVLHASRCTCHYSGVFGYTRFGPDPTGLRMVITV